MAAVQQQQQPTTVLLPRYENRRLKNGTYASLASKAVLKPSAIANTTVATLSQAKEDMSAMNWNMGYGIPTIRDFLRNPAFDARNQDKIYSTISYMVTTAGYVLGENPETTKNKAQNIIEALKKFSNARVDAKLSSAKQLRLLTGQSAATSDKELALVGAHKELILLAKKGLPELPTDPAQKVAILKEQILKSEWAFHSCGVSDLDLLLLLAYKEVWHITDFERILNCRAADIKTNMTAATSSLQLESLINALCRSSSIQKRGLELLSTSAKKMLVLTTREYVVMRQNIDYILAADKTMAPPIKPNEPGSVQIPEVYEKRTELIRKMVDLHVRTYVLSRPATEALQIALTPEQQQQPEEKAPQQSAITTALEAIPAKLPESARPSKTIGTVPLSNIETIQKQTQQPKQRSPAKSVSLTPSKVVVQTPLVSATPIEELAASSVPEPPKPIAAVEPAVSIAPSAVSEKPVEPEVSTAPAAVPEKPVEPEVSTAPAAVPEKPVEPEVSTAPVAVPAPVPVPIPAPAPVSVPVPVSIPAPAPVSVPAPVAVPSAPIKPIYGPVVGAITPAPVPIPSITSALEEAALNPEFGSGSSPLTIDDYYSQPMPVFISEQQQRPPEPPKPTTQGQVSISTLVDTLPEIAQQVYEPVPAETIVHPGEGERWKDAFNVVSGLSRFKGSKFQNRDDIMRHVVHEMCCEGRIDPTIVPQGSPGTVCCVGVSLQDLQSNVYTFALSVVSAVPRSATYYYGDARYTKVHAFDICEKFLVVMGFATNTKSIARPCLDTYTIIPPRDAETSGRLRQTSRHFFPEFPTTEVLDIPLSAPGRRSINVCKITDTYIWCWYSEIPSVLLKINQFTAKVESISLLPDTVAVYIGPTMFAFARFDSQETGVEVHRYSNRDQRLTILPTGTNIGSVPTVMFESWQNSTAVMTMTNSEGSITFSFTDESEELTVTDVTRVPEGHIRASSALVDRFEPVVVTMAGGKAENAIIIKVNVLKYTEGSSDAIIEGKYSMDTTEKGAAFIPPNGPPVSIYAPGEAVDSRVCVSSHGNRVHACVLQKINDYVGFKDVLNLKMVASVIPAFGQTTTAHHYHDAVLRFEAPAKVIGMLPKFVTGLRCMTTRFAFPERVVLRSRSEELTKETKREPDPLFGSVETGEKNAAPLTATSGVTCWTRNQPPWSVLKVLAQKRVEETSAISIWRLENQTKDCGCSLGMATSGHSGWFDVQIGELCLGLQMRVDAEHVYAESDLMLVYECSMQPNEHLVIGAPFEEYRPEATTVPSKATAAFYWNPPIRRCFLIALSPCTLGSAVVYVPDVDLYKTKGLLI